MERRDKINYYLDLAETVSKRCTCLRRRYGAVIVKNDEVISTGYVGAPRGRANCTDLGFCQRDKLSIPRGQRYELCRSLHAEANAIISASRRDMIDATLYLVGKPRPKRTPKTETAAKKTSASKAGTAAKKTSAAKAEAPAKKAAGTKKTPAKKAPAKKTTSPKKP